MTDLKIEDIFPLSPLQQGLLFHAEFDDAAEDVYTVQLSVDLEGRLDHAVLWSAAEALLQRHVNLRAAFRYRKTAEPVQIIISRVALPHSEIDLSMLTDDVREAELARLTEEHRTKRFNLSRAPALRFALIKLSSQHHRLLFTCHHILLDGWSMPLLVDELFSLYRAWVWGRQIPEGAGLPAVTPYRDYLKWLAGRDNEAAEQEWRRALDGVEEPTYLVPGGRADGRAEHIWRTLSADLTARLNEVARSNSLTLNTVVQGVWAILLGQLTRRDDIVFGITVSGRPSELPGSDTMIGLLLNTLPVRVRLKLTEPVSQAMTRLQGEQSRLLAHQHLGLSKIQRFTAAGDLFDTLLVFQNYPPKFNDAEQCPAPRITDISSHDATHYPVSMVAIPGDELYLRLTYRSEAVIPGGAQSLLDRMIRVLEAVAHQPNQPVGRIDMLSASERHELLVEWNDSTQARKPVQPGNLPPIGRPIPDARLYVLGASLQLLPAEVVGELYLGGVGVARGYLGRPALTAERFLPDPFGPPGSRMYRTGDMARWRADGQVEFLGRVDHQVKIRGFRIELPEIENVLIDHDAVAAAVVLARQDRSGDNRLVAYVVAQSGHAPDSAEVLRHVATLLPEYMVPSVVVWLTALPTTVHGKVDREALPIPDTGETTATRKPRTFEEKVLCTAISDILNVPEVGIDDNFFSLGGDSLSAARLVSRIRTTSDLKLSIRDLYASPTVVGLLKKQQDAHSSVTGLEMLLPIRPGGITPPLFCVHPGSGLSWSYTGLARHLDAERPIYGIQAGSLAGPVVVPESLESMADSYVAKIREVQPTGPYHLLGWSFGGVVAHAMAIRLQQQRERLGLVALLDSYPQAFYDVDGEFLEDEERRVFLEGLGLSLAEFMDGELTSARVLEVARRCGSPVEKLDERAISALMSASAHHLRLSAAYTPGCFDGDVLSFEAGIGRPINLSSTVLWKPFVTGSIENNLIDCRHEEITRPEALSRIGPIISEWLEGSKSV